LDHCVDIRFKNELPNHDVSHTKEMGWEELSNGKLLSAAEENSFEVFLTVDKNLRFQQNISKRNLAVITLASLFTGLDHIQPLSPKVLALLSAGVENGKDYIIN
jgi:hypothetical protein